MAVKSSEILNQVKMSTVKIPAGKLGFSALGDTISA
jgi:hypothetical protein